MTIKQAMRKAKDEGFPDPTHARMSRATETTLLDRFGCRHLTTVCGLKVKIDNHAPFGKILLESEDETV